MKLIIDISKETYNAVINDEWIDTEYINNIINSIQNGTPFEEELKNYWICVSDRLPDKDGYYDVIDMRGKKGRYVFNTQGNSKEYWRRCALLWNPLSYKEGE